MTGTSACWRRDGSSCRCRWVGESHPWQGSWKPAGTGEVIEREPSWGRSYVRKGENAKGSSVVMRAVQPLHGEGVLLCLHEPAWGISMLHVGMTWGCMVHANVLLETGGRGKPLHDTWEKNAVGAMQIGFGLGYNLGLKIGPKWALAVLKRKRPNGPWAWPWAQQRQNKNKMW